MFIQGNCFNEFVVSEKLLVQKTLDEDFKVKSYVPWVLREETTVGTISSTFSEPISVMATNVY